jgi:hypothetical protein
MYWLISKFRHTISLGGQGYSVFVVMGIDAGVVPGGISSISTIGCSVLLQYPLTKKELPNKRAAQNWENLFTGTYPSLPLSWHCSPL